MSPVQWQAFFRIQIHSFVMIAYAFRVLWSRSNSPTVPSRTDIDGWATNSLELSALRSTPIRNSKLCHSDILTAFPNLNRISCFQLIPVLHFLFNYSHFLLSFRSYCLHSFPILYLDACIHVNVRIMTEEKDYTALSRLLSLWQQITWIYPNNLPSFANFIEPLKDQVTVISFPA